MTDMMQTVIPKSDQLNFDDLSNGRTLTIKITKVSGKTGDQPIAINYEGDNGKPYMPCKSMRRVLIHNWGGSGAEYVGRSLTLYGDSDVKFGGLAVGGIRISHMSHITKEVTMALTATRANRKPFTVKPLAISEKPKQPTADDFISDFATVTNMDGLKHKYSQAAAIYKDSPEDFARINEAKEKRKAELAA